ncbi:hypothetical protein CI109_106796 [Kwoniella shandongensis]|uniref:DUF7704 domain-containing protein n=1 Tax=Kwoniella shandongensis TaxID=1734106 RepID=A0A5M6C6L1_9TREE|nr:uncharacterized protein CI109_000947 [Kwoniella shandongensis]KAA5530767.1 hypothetical protein CI109_000947 [Kwoniella shandongensis]
MSSILPSSYYYFFLLVEPALTIAGGISAIFDPEGFGSNLLPKHIERATVDIGRTSRGQIIISELGSCFILLAMISISLFYIIKHNLEHQPVIQEKMIKGLLVPLAIADILHVAVTLLPLPISHLKSPSQWTHIVHSTVWITLSLFIVRVLWLSGVGRRTSSVSRVSTTSITSKSPSHSQAGQRPIPLPKSHSQVQVEQLISESKSSEESEEEPKSTPKRRGRPRKTPLAE